MTPTETALQLLREAQLRVTGLLDPIRVSNTSHTALSSLIHHINEDINDALKRSNEEKIRIGILGGRGSGKSTLTNALIGVELLPRSAQIFCTLLPTTITFGHPNKLFVDSEFPDYKYNEIDMPLEQMREILASLTKESENPNNRKGVKEIVIVLDKGILDGKEIVDVPGFTKGNSLHQAYAEQYTKHFCDVCLVLVNNPESIEIGSLEGLEALAYSFRDRLKSTFFLINKCDDSDKGEIDYVRRQLLNHLNGEEANVIAISAKNTLQNSGNQYEFEKLTNSLHIVTNRRALILVESSLVRLISSFRSLKDLCKLTAEELETLHQDISWLLSHGIDEYFKEINSVLVQSRQIEARIPPIDISSLHIPESHFGEGPRDYGARLVDTINSQTSILVDELVEKYQGSIYIQLRDTFNNARGTFDSNIQRKVAEFEGKFKTISHINTPEFENRHRPTPFNPTKIERLKPAGFRRWLEKKLPGVLTRDMKFWLSPVSLSVGPIEVSFGIPIGIESTKGMIRKVQTNIPEQSIQIMNEYLHDTLDSFVRKTYSTYIDLLETYREDWKREVRGYKGRIEVVQEITSPGFQAKIDALINHLQASYNIVDQLTP